MTRDEFKLFLLVSGFTSNELIGSISDFYEFRSIALFLYEKGITINGEFFSNPDYGLCKENILLRMENLK